MCCRIKCILIGKGTADHASKIPSKNSLIVLLDESILFIKAIKPKFSVYLEQPRETDSKPQIAKVFFFKFCAPSSFLK